MTYNRASGDEVLPPTVGQALAQVVGDPAQCFIANWNWKSALVSAFNRGSVLLIATLKRDAAQITVAVAVEVAFSIGVAGVAGAFTQVMRFARPQWLAHAIVGLCIPAVLLGLDYLAHFYTGMQHLRTGLLFVAAWSTLASLFNLYIMRQGVWLVGEHGQPLTRDLKRIPLLIAKFVAAGPAWLWIQAVRVGRRSSLGTTT